jgi:hypothetical protein
MLTESIEQEMKRNSVEYQRLLNNDEWYSRFKGKYVCIINGDFVGSNSNKKGLVVKVRNLYPGHPRMIAKVDRDPKKGTIPSGLYSKT